LAFLQPVAVYFLYHTHMMSTSRNVWDNTQNVWDSSHVTCKSFCRSVW